jgi:GDP-L-fucose synthase
MEIKEKNILITGANGLVGIPTVEKCLIEGAANVYAVDIKTDKLEKIVANNLHIVNTDLTYLDNCEKLFTDFDIDIVLHIAGIKGSPSRTAKCPADYFFPMSMFNNNMMLASYKANVDWFVYLSSVGVYHPADIMHEDDVWKTFPSNNDWHPGWTKRMGELALDALKIQYGWDNWTILRPSNIYGLNDNFAQDATVISSNIWKLKNVPGNIVAWGNGSSKRDFVFGNDVAQATIDVVKKEVKDTINFGCGEAVTIKDTIEAIADAYYEITGERKDIEWDETKPNGDPIRCLSADKQKKYNILPATSLKEGIKLTVKHYLEVQ